MDPSRDPLWTPKPVKIENNVAKTATFKKNIKKSVKMMQTQRPKISCIFEFCSICKKVFKMIPKAPCNDFKICKIATGGLLKAVPKMNRKINANKMHRNQIWEPNCSKKASQNGLRPLTFLCVLWHRLRSCLWEAPGAPKS